MVHLLLQTLAERPTSNGTLLLCFWERDLANTVTHAILLNHRVGHTCHLTQVILSSWGHSRTGGVLLLIGRRWYVGEYAVVTCIWYVPVVTLLKVMASEALPPRAMHIRSNSCSLVNRYWSRGKIWANPRAALVRGAMDT